MHNPSRRAFVALSTIGLAGAIIYPARARGTGTPRIHVYKSPWCGCCAGWVDHMRRAGFDVRISEVDDVDPVKDRHRVPPELRSCHTALTDGYVIEGHVPAGDVLRLLAERPEAVGLAVPGMPAGSPGMEQDGLREPYQVVLFSDAGRDVFARY